MKRIFYVAIGIFAINSVQSQISGGFESNSAWYIDDDKIILTAPDNEERVRSNNYLKLDYKYNDLTAGIQVESYTPQSLLNYYDEFEDTNLGTYYINYNNKKLGLDVTAGHFYEQFGSGLTLRAWEDRQLGIAHSIMGGKAKFTPTESFDATVLYGKQRLGFDLADSYIFGADANLNLNKALKLDQSNLSVGGSFVSRSEEIENIEVTDPTYLISARAAYDFSNFNIDGEYVIKTKDAITDINNDFITENFFEGNAMLLNLGYTKRGFSVTSSLRRLENMTFMSERNLRGNDFNIGNINYVPALTKQNDLLLANIYVYQSQPNLNIDFLDKSGEIGGQVDVFYLIKKGTKLGGKYGTNVALNFSNYYDLDATYDAVNRNYSSKYFSTGEEMYKEVNLEIRKKFSKKYSLIFTYINQFYNKNRIESINNNDNITAHIVGLDNNLKLSGKKSVRFVAEHLSTAQDKKNWAAGLLEFNFSSKFSVYAADLYNYGNDNDNEQLHYYNFGANYNHKKSRISANYGRQRGGLICVGGVCRFVPESNGLSLSINTSF